MIAAYTTEQIEVLDQISEELTQQIKDIEERAEEEMMYSAYENGLNLY